MISNDGSTAEFEVSQENSGMRFDAFLTECSDGKISRTSAVKLIEDGNALLNGLTAAKKENVKAGDIITVIYPAPEPCEAKPQNIPLDIIYEDDYLLVVNKPRGMVVHPAPGNPDCTLVNALLYHCDGHLSGINGVLRPGIVHRIDKDTSGLLVVAKTDEAHRILAERIAAHDFTREYEAIAHGRFKAISGTIDAPIGRDPHDRKKFCVTETNSRHAVTHYEVIEQFKKFSHLKLRLETGRTHQIRVHLSYIGHPIAGDPVYAPRNTPQLGGQCLHARKLGFIHPITSEYLEFDCPPPEYFQKFAASLRKDDTLWQTE